jgi:hypothetical protein
MTTAPKSYNDTGPTCPDTGTCGASPDAAARAGGATSESRPLTSSRVGSPAKTSAWPGAGRVFRLARDLVYGLSSSVLLASYDRALCSWRTSQLSLPGMAPSLLDRLPRWGMTRGGALYELPTPARHTSESDGFVWPAPNQPNGGRTIPEDAEWSTPTAAYRDGRKFQVDLRSAVQRQWPTPRANLTQDDSVNRVINDKGRMISQTGADYGLSLPAAVNHWPTPQSRDYHSGDPPDSPRAQRKQEQGWSPNLNDAVNWPTPQAQDYKSGTGFNPEGRGHTPQLRHISGGLLNPDWVETLMGFPVGWTSLDGPPDPASSSTSGNRRASSAGSRTAPPGCAPSVTRWSRRLCTRWPSPSANGLRRRMQVARANVRWTV